MRYRWVLIAAALTAAGAGTARAQDTSLALRPGMTEADVRQRWGEPLAVRRLNDWTYLFYENGSEAERGYSDCVFLQNGQVVDVIIRGSGRMYLGTSSSPEGRAPEFTPPRRAPTDTTAVPVGGVRVNPPAPAPASPSTPKPER
jgi:hypothetical protein